MKKKEFLLCLGGFLSAAMSLLILIGLVWTPYGTTQMDASAKTQPPSWHHLMGTDNFGRDIFSRVLGGAGTSFLVALAVVAIGCVFGLLIGGLCGYYGGVADAILTRLCDTLTAFPSVLLALVILSLTKGGTYNIILVLGILFIPSFARVVRAEFARCKEQNYVKSARLMGSQRFADHGPAYFAEHHAGSAAQHHHWLQQRHFERGQHELSGPGHPAAGSFPGLHAQRQPDLSPQRPMVCPVHRRHHGSADSGLQYAG